MNPWVPLSSERYGGKAYESDVSLLDDRNFHVYSRRISDAMAHVECLDLVIEKVTIKDGFVYADSGRERARSCQCGVSYRSRSDAASYAEGHPDNGCPYGIVESVLTE